MFELLLIFCMCLMISAIGLRIGIIDPAAVPIIGLVTGGLLGFAYGGAAISGAAVGAIAALAIHASFCKSRS